MDEAELLRQINEFMGEDLTKGWSPQKRLDEAEKEMKKSLEYLDKFPLTLPESMNILINVNRHLDEKEARFVAAALSLKAFMDAKKEAQKLIAHAKSIGFSPTH